MTTAPSTDTEGARRRIVLIDFDWQDADLLPQLLQKPRIAVRLVAGERTEDAGLRMAEICGLPRTLDLADLTREIFDVALVSDRSLRRARVRSLLEALRTPCLSPREFLEREAEKTPAAAAPAESVAPLGPPVPRERDERHASAVDSKASPPAATPPAGSTTEAHALPETPGLGPAARSGRREADAPARGEERGAEPAGHESESVTRDTGDPAHDAGPGARSSVAARHEPAGDEPSEDGVDREGRSSDSVTEDAVAKLGEPAPLEPAPPEPPAGAPAVAASEPTTNGPEAPEMTTVSVNSPEDFESVVERALEGMAQAVAAAGPDVVAAETGRSVQSLKDFPSREDRAALETVLRQLVANTGAVSAELHAGRASLMKLVAQVGSHDPLLEGMVGLALRLNAPQIIKGLSSPHEGKLWGAWPFRTIQHRGVLAASAIDPSGGVSPWEKLVDEMRTRWDQEDRESAVQSFPLLPEQERAWLERADFRARLELAVERNKFDGLAFALHRLEFPGPEPAVQRMCEGLPQLLRGSDYLCRIPPRHVLLLTAVPADAYTHVRRRVLAAWEQVWRECGQTPPAPPIADQRAEMAGPEDAAGFLKSAEAWSSPSS